MITQFLEETNFDKKMIFIVEDDEEYATSLEIFIRNRFSDIKEIKKFRKGEICLLELRHDPCIIIMDYFLKPEFENTDNDLKKLKQMKVLKPKTEIIVLSTLEKFNGVTEVIRDHNCYYVQKDKDTFRKVELLIEKFLKHQKTHFFMWN